jgi:hypothetical protein
MRHRVTAALAVGALLCLNDAPANAAEGGIGAYLWDRARTAPEWAVQISQRAAVLGSFKGRVVALSGAIGYTFEIGKLPVSTRLKVYREFDVVNHLEGTAGFLHGVVAARHRHLGFIRLHGESPQGKVLRSDRTDGAQFTPIQVRSLESFEQLENAVRGSQRNIVQIDRGRMRSQLTHTRTRRASRQVRRKRVVCGHLVFVGPVAFQRRRLCDVRSAIQNGDPASSWPEPLPPPTVPAWACRARQPEQVRASA